MHKTSSDYNAFINANRLKQNVIINRLILVSALIGPALALGVLLGAYHDIKYIACAVATASVLLIWLIQRVIMKRAKGGYAACYAGLIGLQIVLTFLPHLKVGIYLSWFLVPLLSLLYCERRIYITAGVVGYLTMMTTNLIIAPRMSQDMVNMTTMQWYAGYCSGFTIEYALMFVVGLALNKVTNTHLQHFYNSRLEADSAMQTSDSLKQIAVTDSLTGLFNRRAFDDEITGMKGNLPYAFTVLILDVNGLKRVNDAWGHDAGDRIIRGAANCLTDVFGYSGKCYRTGGDEFTVLFSADAVTSRMLAEDLAEKTSKWVDETGSLRLSVSYGWACSSEFPEADARELIRTADMRMYVKKNIYHSENAD